MAENVLLDAEAVMSSDGEVLTLNNEVTLENGVEVWLKHLKSSIEDTLKDMLSQAIIDVNNGVALEDLTFKVDYNL